MKDINVLKRFGVNVDKSLELLGDMETYDEILMDFVEELDKKLLKANGFVELRDLPNYAILVHSLKSAARYLGFDALGEVFYKHELEGKSTNLAFVENHFKDLLSEVDRAKNAISRYLTGEDSSGVEVTKKVDADIINEKTLIVADDSELIRKIINRIFEKEENFKIQFALDGEEVISIIKKDLKNRVAGMLLDLNMPNKDGFAVLDYLKTNDLFNKIPVSIISGNDDEENVKKAFTYPIIDMLKKPFSESEVRNIVIKTIK